MCVRAGHESTLKSAIAELELAIKMPRASDPQESAPVIGNPSPGPGHPLILISHSSEDAALATALVELLRVALLTGDIRCSSVDGFRLPAGVDTDIQLKGEVNSSHVVVGLITPNSLRSAYVMFELGARWGAGKSMLPLLAGVKPGDIRGPLSGVNALDANNSSQLHQLIEDLAQHLHREAEPASKYGTQLATVTERAHALNSLHQQQTGPVEQHLERTGDLTWAQREYDRIMNNRSDAYHNALHPNYEHRKQLVDKLLEAILSGEPPAEGHTPSHKG